MNSGNTLGCHSAALLKCALFVILSSSSLHAQLAYPAGGEILHQGNIVTIRWQAESRLATVDILLWNGRSSRHQRLAVDVPGESGMYQWHVPKALEGDRFRIKVASSSNPSVYIISGTYFTISGPVSPMRSVIGSSGLLPTGTVAVYPTPASNRIAIHWTGITPQFYEIVSINGQKVRTGPIEPGTVEIELTPDLVSGAYVIRVMDATGHGATAKLIVQ